MKTLKIKIIAWEGRAQFRFNVPLTVSPKAIFTILQALPMPGWMTSYTAFPAVIFALRRAVPGFAYLMAASKYSGRQNLDKKCASLRWERNHSEEKRHGECQAETRVDLGTRRKNVRARGERERRPSESTAELARPGVATDGHAG